MKRYTLKLDTRWLEFHLTFPSCIKGSFNQRLPTVASSGSLLEMQMFGPHCGPTESEPLELGAQEIALQTLLITLRYTKL